MVHFANSIKIKFVFLINHTIKRIKNCKKKQKKLANCLKSIYSKRINLNNGKKIDQKISDNDFWTDFVNYFK